MRRKIVYMLSVLMVVLLAGAAPAGAADFFGVADFERYTESDGDFHWAKNDLKLAVASELFRGYPPEKPEMIYHWRGTGGVTTKVLGELKPDARISRGEYAAIVCRALDMESAEYGRSPFSDVNPSQWFGPSVLRLVAAGIIDPADYGGKLNPNGPITRQEIAVWMVRAAERAGVKVEPADVSFRDFDSGSKQAPYVAKAVGLGILKGYPDGTFRPGGTANRAEAAVMLVRLLKHLPLFDGIDGEKAKRMMEQTVAAMTEMCKSWPVNLRAGWERNEAFENALARYQAGVKDLVTEYNLWPRIRPDGFGPLGALDDEVGPRNGWSGLAVGYGLVDGMLLRVWPKESAFVPAVYMGGNFRATDVVDFVGRGPIAEVNVGGSAETLYVTDPPDRPRKHPVDYGCRALLVKQGGEWKIAALYYDDDHRGPWLRMIGFVNDGGRVVE